MSSVVFFLSALLEAHAGDHRDSVYSLASNGLDACLDCVQAGMFFTPVWPVCFSCREAGRLSVSRTERMGKGLLRSTRYRGHAWDGSQLFAVRHFSPLVTTETSGLLMVVRVAYADRVPCNRTGLDQNMYLRIPNASYILSGTLGMIDGSGCAARHRIV